MNESIINYFPISRWSFIKVRKPLFSSSLMKAAPMLSYKLLHNACIGNLIFPTVTLYCQVRLVSNTTIPHIRPLDQGMSNKNTSLYNHLSSPAGSSELKPTLSPCSIIVTAGCSSQSLYPPLSMWFQPPVSTDDVGHDSK